MAHSEHKISMPTAIIIGMNAMIGAGIFAAPAALAHINGVIALCTYIFVIATVWALALSISRLAALYPKEGAFYTYASQWGGHVAGVSSVSLYLVGLFIAMGLLANLASSQLHELFPAIPAPYMAYAILALLTALNVAGAELSEIGQTILIICTVFPLLVTTGICFLQADTSHIAWPEYISIKDILTSAKSIIFGFFGFESAAALYNVVYQPEKNVPKAVTYSIILVGALYLAFITSVLLATPPSFLKQAPSLPAILQYIMPGYQILTILINVSIFSAIVGTLHAMLWSASSLLQSSVTLAKDTWHISRLQSVICVASIITLAYTCITDLETYFSLTVLGVVSAYSLSVITLLTLPQEWKNGQNVITVTGLMAAGAMIVFALQHFIPQYL